MYELPKQFCTTRQAAIMLGVSVTITQNLAESGLLESWKTEVGHRRITSTSVEDAPSLLRLYQMHMNSGHSHLCSLQASTPYNELELIAQALAETNKSSTTKVTGTKPVFPTKTNGAPQRPICFPACCRLSSSDRLFLANQLFLDTCRLA